MTSLLYECKIRSFEYPKFAEPYRNRLRGNAEYLAAEAAFPEKRAPGDGNLVNSYAAFAVVPCGSMTNFFATPLSKSR